MVNRLFLLCLSFSLGSIMASAQDILFTESFNECTLSADWTVALTGNPDALWYVGMPANENSDGSSIDGSCMLIIDDDGTGEATPGFDLSLTSPAFDGTGYTTIGLSMDVHFRNYNGADSLEIIVDNGTSSDRIALYRGGGSQTGEQFSEFITFTADLSFFASEEMQLVIHYADGEDWGWWAGIDNITVWGEGEGSNILLETFNDCALPTGWFTEVVTGEDDWQFGYLDNENTGITSMNGSCFLYFDDDGIGQDAPNSTVRLVSPEIDGTLGSKMLLSFDLIIRTYEENESLLIGVYDVDNDRFQVLRAYNSDVGGPQMNEFLTQELDLSALRSRRMHLVFQYDDGDTWGWWMGIDNLKLSASGELNELCAKAEPISVGTDTCLVATTELALFDGPQPSCSTENVGSLWYIFTAEQSSWLRITSAAKFNDVLTVLTGDCADPVPLSCDNRDEHGFTGEDHYLQVEAGEDYYLRISGQAEGFGIAKGSFCLDLAYVTGPPEQPVNQACAAALDIEIDGDCVAGDNFWAQFPAPLPSRANLARAGIWYQFTPTSTDDLLLRATADFAHALTLFAGDCNGLNEIAANEYGETLRLSDTQAGQTYYLQVTGAFATVEGSLCASIERYVTAPPANDDCVDAITLPLGGECVFASNTAAEFDGPAISCDPFLTASIWFELEAPGSGSIQLLADADFAQSLAIYSGDCGALEEIFCASNPLACDGYLTVGGLSPGETYLIRLSSLADVSGVSETGSVCIRARDAALMPAGEALDLQVTYDCYGNGTAVLDIQVSGGDGNYFFEGDGEQSLVANGETYLVIVTDGRGCSRSASGQVECAVEMECNLMASVEVLAAASCFNTADGAVMITASGGNEAYTYQWPDGQSGASVSTLLPGEYVVTVLDGEGCSAGVPFTITSPEPILLDILDVQNANGGANGSISFETLGGVAPLMIRIYRNGVYEPDLSADALPLGNYEIEVEDANGCIVLSEVVTILDPTDTDIAAAESYWVKANPNPTAGPVRLDWRLPDACELSVLDIMGRPLTSPRALAASMTNYHLDFSRYPAGIYLLRWSIAGEHWVQRVVVE